MALPQTNLTINVDASTNTDLWTDDAMTTHPTNGQAVAMWNDVGDATGNAFGWFATGTTPTYSVGTFNGLDALYFANGGTVNALTLADDGFSALQPLSTLITDTDYTVFISFILEGDASNSGTYFNNTCLLGDQGGYFGVIIRTDTGVNTIYAYNYDGSQTAAGAVISQNTKYVVMTKHVGGVLYVDVNNGLATNSVSSGNTGSLAAAPQVGASVAGPQLEGRIGEIAVYNADVTGTDLSDAWSYFLNKWVTAAATGNPWYTYAQQYRRPRLPTWLRSAGGILMPEPAFG